MYGPRLDGERVTLAPPRLEYAEDYVRWFGDPAVTRYMERRTPFSRAQEEDYLRQRPPTRRRCSGPSWRGSATSAAR